MTGILTKKDVIELTGYQRYQCQCRALDHMGIRYRKRLNGSPVVTWDAVNGGRSTSGYEINIDEVA